MPSYPNAGQVAPCSFQLDVQWILDIIEKIQSGLNKIGSFINGALRKAAAFLRKLSGILSWFCIIPGLGKFAKDFVARACELIGDVSQRVLKMQAQSLDVLKHLLAPWEVRSAGRGIVDQIVPNCEQFADALRLRNLATTTSWQGQAAEAFRQSLTIQQEAASSTASAASEFGSAVETMGDEGVSVTIKFATGMTFALITMALAIAKMVAIPVGTAVGAAEIIGIISGIVGLIKVLVEALRGLLESISTMQRATQRAVPGGMWPAALN